MQPTHSARLEKRMFAGVAAAMLALVGCSVCVIEHDSAAPDSRAEQRPFWSSDTTASNLAVVELHRSGAASWQGTP